MTLVAALVVGFGLACGSGTSPSPTPEPVAEPEVVLPAYKILNDEKRPSIKRVVDVRLEGPVEEADLRNVADAIKGSDRGRYERTFITYLLPDMEPGLGAWATFHFNPDLDINIMGATPSQIEAMGRVPEVEGSELLGSWMEHGLGRRFALYKAGGGYTLATKYKDGSGGDEQMVGKQTADGLRLLTEPGGPNETGDHYLLLSDGRFRSADNEGPIWTLSP